MYCTKEKSGDREGRLERILFDTYHGAVFI